MKLWIRLRVEGLNIDRQFARMTGSGVAVRDVDRKGHKITEEQCCCFFPAGVL